MKYEGTFGRKQEQRVIATIEQSGYEILPPTREEDVYMDIDAWVESFPVSIKSPTPKSVNQFGRIVLEHKVKLLNGNWYDSWFKTGQSHGYLFLLNDELWYADKRALNQFMEMFEDDEDIIKWRQLTARTKQNQIARGHPHCDAVNANVRIDKLKEQEVLKYCGELGGFNIWIPLYSKTNTVKPQIKNVI